MVPCMRRLLVALAFQFVALVAAPASAQDGEPQAACTRETAQQATVEQLAGHFRDWAGRCVRVRGLHVFGTYGTDNRLYADRLAVLGVGPSLTINYHNDIEHERHRPRWEEVVGTFGSCVLEYEALDRYYQAHPNTIPMLGGLCHYTLDAPYIVPVEYRGVEGPPVTRLRRAEVPAALRELEPVEVTDLSDFPGHDIFEQALEALADEDFEAFVRLSDHDLFERLSSMDLFEQDLFDLQEVGAMADQIDRLYEVWYEFDEARDPRLFAMRPTDEDQAEESFAIYCMLREGRTIEDFPVRWRDIDNDPARPYFCVKVGDFDSTSSLLHPFAEVPYFTDGFVEGRDQPGP